MTRLRVLVLSAGGAFALTCFAAGVAFEIVPLETVSAQETVYTPRQSNDRLLLGLKGSLNEYELDLLRQRSVEARREKARRGELVLFSPAGYIKAEGHWEKDPDRRVQDC